MISKEIIEKQLKIPDEYRQHTRKLAIELISELKSGSATYKEVNEKLKHLKDTIKWNPFDFAKYDYLFDEISRLLENEKNGLPIQERDERNESHGNIIRSTGNIAIDTTDMHRTGVI